VNARSAEDPSLWRFENLNPSSESLFQDRLSEAHFSYKGNRHLIKRHGSLGQIGQLEVSEVTVSLLNGLSMSCLYAPEAAYERRR
jgi:hypothetical protein